MNFIKIEQEFPSELLFPDGKYLRYPFLSFDYIQESIDELIFKNAGPLFS